MFYYTHLLYIPYYVLLILHGPNFWKWFIVPGVIYVIERIIRLVRTKTGQGRTYISSGILLPSKVTHLVSTTVCSQLRLEIRAPINNAINEVLNCSRISS